MVNMLLNFVIIYWTLVSAGIDDSISFGQVEGKLNFKFLSNISI